MNSKNTYVSLLETNISNKYERDNMFIRDSNYTYTQWLDVTDEHFIVWMQMESFSEFKKLYAKIPDGLDAGKYTLSINNSKLFLIQSLMCNHSAEPKNFISTLLHL